jgi:hypothetical protein
VVGRILKGRVDILLTVGELGCYVTSLLIPGGRFSSHRPALSESVVTLS